jgi:hypothetical protein
MLWALCVVLLILWVLGMAISSTASGLVALVRLFQGHRPLG